MAKAKVRADCRADTRGGAWAGIPLCVINSAAHRHLSLYARAILVEITGRMNGWNNGAIAVSQRELREALSCSPNRVVRGVAELMEHGLLDVTTEGQWKERRAREYRLTFVTTKARPATNDYLRWAPMEKSGATDAVAGKGQSATDAVAAPPGIATDAIAAIAEHRRKTAISRYSSATDAVPLISKPYPPSRSGQVAGANDRSETPYSAAGHRFDIETDAQAILVRNALSEYRDSKGLIGVSRLAHAACIEPARVIAFLEHRDLLSAPTIARLNREIGRAA